MGRRSASQDCGVTGNQDRVALHSRGLLGYHEIRWNVEHSVALAHDNEQEDPINARAHPVFLPTPPGADETQLRAILFAPHVIAHPGPWPAAARGRTRAGGMTRSTDCSHGLSTWAIGCISNR